MRRAGVMDVMGETGESNVQGERVKKLDEIANDTLMRCLGYRDDVAILVSEEEEGPRVLKSTPGEGRYVVLFDPLDGSSNIDVMCLSVRFFRFSKYNTIYRWDRGSKSTSFSLA